MLILLTFAAMVACSKAISIFSKNEKIIYYARIIEIILIFTALGIQLGSYINS